MFYCYFELDSKSTERGLKMKLYLILLSVFFLASPFSSSYEIKGPPEVFNTSQSPSEKEEPATLKQKVIKKLWEKLQSSGLNEATKKETQNKKTKNQEKKKNSADSKPASNTKKDSGNTISKSKKNPPSKPFANKKTTYKPTCTIELKIEGAIGAATLDILERAIYRVKKQNCSALLLLINTPGGQLLTTRKIVDRILNTDFPVLCLIHPAGAHAGSAGAIIMQACHVNGGIETTNIGAATPIMGSGQKISDDLRKKLINDTTSWLDSLTQLRKRSKKFGREIITEAKAVSATEAQKEKAIDFVGKTKLEFLQFADGGRRGYRQRRQNDSCSNRRVNTFAPGFSLPSCFPHHITRKLFISSLAEVFY